MARRAAFPPRRQCPQRVAVVALPSGDHAGSAWHSPLDGDLPRQLEGGFDRFGPARDQQHAVDPFRGGAHQPVGQRFGRFRGEEPGMREGDLIDLGVERGPHPRVRVAQTGHGRPARAIEIPSPVSVEEVAALSANDSGQGLGRAAKDMPGHVQAKPQRSGKGRWSGIASSCIVIFPALMAQLFRLRPPAAGAAANL